MEKQSELLFTARIDACYEQLTKTEKKIADFMKENLDLVAESSAQKIAELAGTGPATLIRFCRDCGYSGLTELKISLKRETLALDRMEDMNILESDSVAVIKQKVLKFHTKVIESASTRWNEEALEQAVELILNADRILISGIGDSRIMAMLLHNNLDLMNFSTRYYLDAVEEMNFIAGMTERDLLIGFTYSARYRDTVMTFKLVKQTGASTIGILGIPGEQVEKYIDVPLYSGTGQREYYFSSRNNMIEDIAIIEILAAVLSVRQKDYQDHMKKMGEILEQYRIPKNEKI